MLYKVSETYTIQFLKFLSESIRKIMSEAKVDQPIIVEPNIYNIYLNKRQNGCLN